MQSQRSADLNSPDPESVLIATTLIATAFGVGAGTFFAIHEYVGMVICLGVIVAHWLTMRHNIRRRLAAK